MNESDDIASAVVSEQLSRMLEQERKELEFTPLLVVGQEQLPLSGDQVFELALHAIVMAKISIISRLN